MLVPLIVLYDPPFHVEKMLTPGAPRSTAAPKLLNDAKVSSAPYEVAGPNPPGAPSESASADTVITASLYAAGTELAVFAFSLLAATAYVTPPETALPIAS